MEDIGIKSEQLEEVFNGRKDRESTSQIHHMLFEQVFIMLTSKYSNASNAYGIYYIALPYYKCINKSVHIYPCWNSMKYLEAIRD